MLVCLRTWCAGLAGLALGGCFSPAFEDGTLTCGDAGCPPGLACSADGVCRNTGGDTDDTVLAIARDGAPAMLYAWCDGAAVTAWQLDRATRATSVAWGAGDGGRADLMIGSGGDGGGPPRRGAPTIGTPRGGGRGIGARRPGARSGPGRPRCTAPSRRTAGSGGRGPRPPARTCARWRGPTSTATASPSCSPPP